MYLVTAQVTTFAFCRRAPKSTDHRAQMTSENHHCVCSQLRLQQAGRLPPTTQRKSKIDRNTRPKHITKEYLTKGDAATHGSAKFTRLCDTVAQNYAFTFKFPIQNDHSFDYLCKISNHMFILFQ